MRAFRLMAGVFALGTAAVVALFVVALGDQEIRTGLLTYALFTGAAAVGLWRVTRWGRNLALVAVLGNAALGSLTLLASILETDASPLIPGIVFAAALLFGYLLSRDVFTLPADHG